MDVRFRGKNGRAADITARKLFLADFCNNICQEEMPSVDYLVCA
jgi:hypothetical protein